MLPNFLIVGVAKAGTTTLYHHLNKHPDIFIPDRKECRYYSEMPGDFNGALADYQNDVIKSQEEYEKLFEEGSHVKMRGDISNDYFYYHEKSIKNIKSELGDDVPIIIVLRNPISRAYSNYLHVAREGAETLSFRDSLELEEQRMEKNWSWPWFFKETSLYSQRLQAYLDNFPNTKVIFFEEYPDFQGIVDEVISFLGLESITVDSELKFNRTGKPRFSKVSRLLNSDNPLKRNIVQGLKSLISEEKVIKMREKIMAINLKKEPIDEETSTILANYFYEDVRSLEKITGKDLKNLWKI